MEVIATQLSHSSVNTTMRYVNNSNRLGQWYDQSKGR